MLKRGEQAARLPGSRGSRSKWATSVVSGSSIPRSSAKPASSLASCLAKPASCLSSSALWPAPSACSPLYCEDSLPRKCTAPAAPAVTKYHRFLSCIEQTGISLPAMQLKNLCYLVTAGVVRSMHLSGRLSSLERGEQALEAGQRALELKLEAGLPGRRPSWRRALQSSAVCCIRS